MPPFHRKKRDIHTYAHTNITRKALKFGAIMEKTPNSSAPTLKLVNGPAGRDHLWLWLIHFNITPRLSQQCEPCSYSHAISVRRLKYVTMKINAFDEGARSAFVKCDSSLRGFVRHLSTFPFKTLSNSSADSNSFSNNLLIAWIISV
jgi:hypothetical protein